MAYIAIAMVGLSVIAIIVLAIAGANASGKNWAIVQLIPLIALPIGFVLIFVLLIVSLVRRGRAARDAGQ